MRRLRRSGIAGGAAVIALWTAAAGCTVTSVDGRGGGHGKPEARRGIADYCPEILQRALHERAQFASFVTVDYCICADIQPCNLCEFSRSSAVQGKGEAPSDAEVCQASAAVGEVVCQVLREEGGNCCNCCASVGASQIPLK